MQARTLRLMLAVTGCLCAASPAMSADYWVRGEATAQGVNIPAACPAAGTRFSAVAHTPTKAVCQAHATCTAVKIQAVNNWIAQLNQRNLGQCVQYIQQAQAPCSYNC